MPAPIPEWKRQRLLKLVYQDGMKIRPAAFAVGVSYSWARDICKGFRNAADAERVEQAERRSLDTAEVLNRPFRRDELTPTALRALDDFDLFRKRYLGRVTLPWHVQAAEQIVTALETDEREFLVMSVAPGSGKSTLLHDAAAWVTTRDRRLRGMFGSRVAKNAQRQTAQLRRTFEQTIPTKAKEQEIQRGLAVDAESCLALDYGLFRPPTRIDLWRRDEFIVLQDDGIALDDKEPTWSAVGQDTGFLGNRFDVIFWDDLVDGDSVASLDAIEAQRKWYDDEAESRLEPGGAMFHVGQRFAAADLYRYNLDKRMPIVDDDDEPLSLEEIKALEGEQPRKYRHIMFPAHDQSRCQGKDTHRTTSPAWPEGCLLDPKRVSWRDCSDLMLNNPAKWSIQYQQEDANPEDVLVKDVWVKGGTDPDTGTLHFSCWDDDRGLWELPPNLAGPKVSFATVDPSPTKWWAIQAWVWTPESNTLWLMDCLRKRMGGNDLLDWIEASKTFVGVMEDWQQQSRTAGVPISRWIVEVNAAQRFLLQHDYMKRWMRLNHTFAVPHTTTLMKLDEKLGVDMAREWWASSRIRLPGRGIYARSAAQHLVDEVTRYPNAGTDDQVMAHWFGLYNLQKMRPITRRSEKIQRRPSSVLDITDWRARHNSVGRIGA